MKLHPISKTVFSTLLFGFLLGTSVIRAQTPGLIAFSEVSVGIKDVTVEGPAAEYPIAPGKPSGPYQLYVSDSLMITAVFKLVGGASGRSDLKDSSVKLNIEYTVDYQGYLNDKKVERIFYLDEERKFTEKETFSIAKGKYSNTIIRFQFSGRLQ